VDYIEQLRQIEKKMREESRALHKVIKSLPKGTVMIGKEGDFIRISQVHYAEKKFHKKGIKRNQALAQALVKKSIYSEYVRRMDNNILLLESALSGMLALDEKSVYNDAPANIELVLNEYFNTRTSLEMNPVYDNDVLIMDFVTEIPKEERAAWGQKPYRANAFNLETKKHRTLEGVELRSKSELALYEIYKKHNYPVHYDELVRIRGKMKSPDFIAMRRDGKVIVHEHCGLVTDQNYMKNHNEKIMLYESAGIVPWDNLIVTYDLPGGGIDLRLAEAEICAKMEV